GHQDRQQDAPQQHRWTQEKYGTERFEILEHANGWAGDSERQDECQDAVFDVNGAIVDRLRHPDLPAFGSKAGQKVLQCAKGTERRAEYAAPDQGGDERESHDHQCGEVACEDRKSTRLNSSHVKISYAVFCLKKKKKNK